LKDLAQGNGSPTRLLRARQEIDPRPDGQLDVGIAPIRAQPNEQPWHDYQQVVTDE
jgi:hypothetical protein